MESGGKRQHMGMGTAPPEGGQSLDDSVAELSIPRVKASGRLPCGAAGAFVAQSTGGIVAAAAVRPTPASVPRQAEGGMWSPSGRVRPSSVGAKPCVVGAGRPDASSGGASARGTFRAAVTRECPVYH